MKKIYNFLMILLWSFIGVFIGTSLYRFYDFKAHPELYAMISAPWYLSIQLNAILTAIIVLILFVITRVIKKKIK